MKRVFYSLALLTGCISLTGCQNQIPEDVRFTLVILIVIFIGGLFFLLATSSNLLRDEISNSEEFDENARKISLPQKSSSKAPKGPFSLTKVQFGIWTVVISSSYIYLSLLKGDCANVPINKTAIVMMGIFSGLAAATTILDKREISDNRPRHQNTPSAGFFNDILSDDNGISLHRFQNLVWTIIAVIVYLNKLSAITTGCVLPELSDTLLALTGLSTATYLVMKTQENDPPVAEAIKNNSNPATPAEKASIPAS